MSTISFKPPSDPGRSVLHGGRLIVGESMTQRYTAFSIRDDATLTDRRVWADVGPVAPDGCVLDAEGGEVLETIAASQTVYAIEVVEVDTPGAGWPQ